MIRSPKPIHRHPLDFTVTITLKYVNRLKGGKRQEDNYPQLKTNLIEKLTIVETNKRS